MSRLIASNWFLLALIGCYAGGHYGASWLHPITSLDALRSSVVMTVMWAMGVTLDADQIKASVRKPVASLLAIGCNLFLVPLGCFLGMLWLTQAVAGPLGEELAGGLFVAGLVPCTLASASVWTRKAGGDDSISMICTVVTNLACLLVVPIGIQLVLAMQANIAPLAQMEKLAWFVVLPLIVAQTMRRLGMNRWADKHKTRLSALAQAGILAMVVFGAVASRSVTSGQGGGLGFGAILAVIGTAAGVHVSVCFAAILLARTLRLSREEQIAVGISGSQKTLMVGLQIAIDCGVSVIPMMVYHAGQLVIDTFISNRWKQGSHTSTESTDVSSPAEPRLPRQRSRGE